MNSIIAKMQRKSTKNIIIIIILLLFAGIAIYGFYNGWFASVEALRVGIDSLGMYGIIIFILIQIVQVVIPIIPSLVVSIAGVIIYGPIFGFIYNYIGICIGSLIVFALAKSYGIKLLEKMFSQRLLEKYGKWTRGSKFTLFFAGAIACPGMPDDFLCYLAGTSKIKTAHYMMIIFIGRATTLLGYSLFLNLFYTAPIA